MNIFDVEIVYERVTILWFFVNEFSIIIAFSVYAKLGY